ncbi:MAG: hypothetical protein IJ308_01425 [Clostridia bacterium]|nr:hypothetical protein [Clostridia bacterium]
MAKFNVNDYEFIDFSEDSTFDFDSLSAEEFEQMVQDTMEVLKARKGKLLKSPDNLCLVSGVLAARDGEFISIAPIMVRWKKGNTSKAERKIIKKVFTTAKWYYLFRNLLANMTKNGIGTDGIYPYLARKIK